MRNKSIIVGIFFGLLLLTGILVYKDYGISWDEPIQRTYGEDVFNFILKGDKKLYKNKDKFYGPVIEVSLVSLENILQLKEIRDVYLMRHLVNFLIFFVSIFFFYLLLTDRFRSVWFGLLGSTMLFLSPRIFAHSFYNSKDLPFMAFFIIAVYFVHRLYKYSTMVNTVIAGIATAILIDVRIGGVVLPAIVIGLFVYNFFTRSLVSKFNLGNLLSYLTVTALFTVILFPTLWNSPIETFGLAFEQLSNYPQSTSTIYFGKSIKSNAIPWHYVLGWVAYTTPVIYSIMFVLGLVTIVKRWASLKPSDLLIVGWFFLPLIIIVILKSSLYDAWRQMFFIYPAFIYIGVYAVFRIKSEWLRTLLVIFFPIAFFFIGKDIVSLHPYQNIYFSELIKYDENLVENFSLDYWGLSYKEGLEYIAKTDKRENIKINAESFPGETNLIMLPSSARKRFEYVESREDADYYLTNYRKYKDEYNKPAYFTVEVNGVRILGVHAKN